MNLRKDHCRNLPSRTTRGRVNNTTRGGGCRKAPIPRGPVWASCVDSPSSDGEALDTPRPAWPNNETPARIAPRNSKLKEHAVAARSRRARGRAVSIENLKRLSATDISALASMKNVAKCDTWCELQNPVNHRVFERKLRPKPLGRGHVCLGVTHRRPHPHRAPPRAPWG